MALSNTSNIPGNLTTPSVSIFSELFSLPIVKHYLVFRTIFYTILILLGVFGNIMTITIIRRFKSSRSATDRYFMCLAVTDLCVVVTSLFPTWLRSATGFRIIGSHDIACKIFGSVYNMAVASSSWILATLAAHRALMVTWPHRVNAICTPRRSWSAVIAIIVFSCVAFSHLLYGFRVIPPRRCSASGEYAKFLIVVWLPIETFLHSALPSLCILLSNVVLVSKLTVSFREAGDQLAASDTHMTSRSKTVSSVTLQAVVVSISFLVLTLPVAVWNTTSYLFPDHVATDLLAFALRALAESTLYVLLDTNYCVNFYLYCLTFETSSKRFCAVFIGKATNCHVEKAL